MTPMEVRDRLESIGFDLSKYSSSLAAIHTVLKRLNEAREVGFVELDSGKFGYTWRQARATPALSEAYLARLAAPRPTKPGRRRKE